ncbi:MAG: hypothetical protein AABY53_02440 [Bdellovibrionota bacterium]
MKRINLIAISVMFFGLKPASACNENLVNLNRDIDIHTAAYYNSDGSPNCEVRKLALFLLKTSNDHKVLDSALSLIKGQGHYSTSAATIVFDLLKKENPDEIRALAAQVWYLLFYKLTEPELQEQSFTYLLNEKILTDIIQLVNHDKVEDVRRYVAQIGQVLLGPYRNLEKYHLRTDLSEAQLFRAEKLGEVFIPIFLNLLLFDMSEVSANIRGEILVALDNLSIAKAAVLPNNLALFIKWNREETDPSNMGRLDDNPILGPLIKSKP